EAPAEILWVTVLPVPAVLSWAWLRRRPWRATARRVDAHYGLDDQLGNALELSRVEGPARGAEGVGQPPDPRTAEIVALVQERARTLAAGLDPRPVVPLRVPTPRVLDGVAAAAAIGAMFVPPPDPPVVFSDEDPI